MGEERFSTYDKEFLLYGFEIYCRDEKSLQEPTIVGYLAIIEKYFNQKVVNKIKKDMYSDLFSIENLQFIQEYIGSNIKKAATINFLAFLRHEKIIENDINFYNYQNNIDKSIIVEKNKTEKKTNFLSPSEMKMLFSDKISYNSELEEKLSPFVISLHVFCLYKQKDIKLLKLSDIDLESKTIRNIRYDENNNLSEYIKMNDVFYESLINYMEYRDRLESSLDNLVLYKSKVIENSGFNAIFNVFTRSDNKEFFKNKSIHSDIILKSMILYLLIYREDSLNLIFKLLPKESNLFRDVFKEYIDIKIHGTVDNEIEIDNLNILFDNKKEDEYRTFKDQIKDTNEEEFEKFFIPYSIRNDLSLIDLEEADIENSNNLESNKIIIQRLVRDSKIARLLKNHYKNECQLCNYKLRKSDGNYLSEAHHLKPYNRTHKGDDTTKNMIVLCPNCHAQFDDQYYAIHPQTLLIHCVFEDDEYHLSNLKLNHTLGTEYLQYAWESFSIKKNKYNV